MKQLRLECILGASKNSDFSARARKYRADDCMDAAARRSGGRAKQDARAENLSVYAIHDGLSTRLTPLSQKKRILRGTKF